MKKSVRIAIISGLLICAAILVTAVIILTGGTKGGNPDCRYPYKWNTKNDKTAVFSVANPEAEGSEWVLDAANIQGQLDVTLLESKGGKTTFTLKPIVEGLYSFMLSCKNKDRPDMIFDATVLVDSDLSVATIRVQEQDFGELAKGEAENLQYVIYPYGDGSIEILLNYLNGGKYTWATDTDSSERLSWSPESIDDQTQSIIVSEIWEETSIEKGEVSISQPADKSLAQQETAQSKDQQEPVKDIVTIKLYGKDTLKKTDLKLSVSYVSGNYLIKAIESHAIETVTHVTDEEILLQNKEKAENESGLKVKIIETSENFDFKLSGSEKNKNQIISAYFIYDDIIYDYVVSKDIQIDTLLNDYLKTWEEGKGKNSAKDPYTAYLTEYSIALSWSENGVNHFLISDIDTGLEKIQEVASLLKE